MPNWCWNTIEFTGEEKNVENLSKLIDKTIEMQEKTGFGQLLFGLDGSIDGYMFDISNVDSDKGWIMFSFQSRWNPIPNDMVRIAELFGLDFTYDYEESGMALYGKYTFEITEGESYLYEQVASETDIEACRILDEDGEEEGQDYEKLENLIASNEMCSQSITRLENIAV